MMNLAMMDIACDNFMCNALIAQFAMRAYRENKDDQFSLILDKFKMVSEGLGTLSSGNFSVI